MAINFPSSPATNDTHTDGGITWTFDGTSWVSTPTNSPTFDALTVTGDLTVDSTTLYVDSTNNRVGIGTTTPSELLDINAGTSGSVELTTTDGRTIQLTANDSEPYLSVGSTSDHSAAIMTNGVRRLIVDSSGNVGIGTNSPAVELDVSGAINASGELTFNGFDAGYRNIPISGSEKTTSYTLATTDVGEYIQVGTGGSVTIPDATFSQGDVLSIVNNTTGNITITCTITTAYIAGTNTDKASVVLATRGVATVLFLSGTACIITGNVS